MKIYNSCPTKISNNFVIKDTEMIKNHSMFLKIPPNKTSLYQKLGDEFGMWLIKSGDQRMMFRSEDSIECGERGQNHVDLSLRYKGGDIKGDIGLFRLICTNGLEEFFPVSKGFKFKDVMLNKINPDVLIEKNA